MNKIYFNSKGPEGYKWLSAFYPCEINGYPTLEHYYVSQKTNILKEKLKVKNCKTSAQVKQLGKILTIRKDWDDIKFKIMFKGLKIKFSKEPFTTLLLKTNDKELIHYCPWGDTLWGVDSNYKGANIFGLMVMKIRDNLNIDND